MGSGRTSPPFLSLALDGWVVNFIPQSFYFWGKSPWTQKLVWTLWRRDKSLTPAGDRIPADHPMALAIPTELPWILLFIYN
jgi:hypothetical protein